MTRYSRSVIPGRSNGDASSPAEIDRLVFGQKGRAPLAGEDEDEDHPAPANDDRALLQRAVERRLGSRRLSEYAPLPQEGKKFRSPDENGKRGPVLLFGALAVVAVFGLVVWNAYREGVRPQDSNTAPLLETSGAFKSKPDTATPSSAEQASVFEQVEAPARSIVDPAPEIRAEPTPPAQAVAPPPEQTRPSAVAPAPVKLVETKPAGATPTPPRPADTKPAQAAALASVPAATLAPKAEAPISLTPSSPALAGGYTPAFVPGGKFAVQVAAASTEAGAIAEWNKHAKFSPELFSAAERLIVQADVNGRTVYRLRVGSFATAADADAFCSAFKARGGQCFRAGK